MKTIPSILLMILLLIGCRSVKPILTSKSDSTDTKTIIKDSIVYLQGDSSMARYLIEARIRQILTQAPGQYLQTPIATIDNNNVLTTSAVEPGREIHVQNKYVYLKSVKAQVYVQFTNYLKWWQQWLMYIGAGAILVALTILTLKIIHIYKTRVL